MVVGNFLSVASFADIDFFGCAVDISAEHGNRKV